MRELSIVECRKCGASYWFGVAKPQVLESGPCCFGHEVMDIERYPTMYMALKAYPAWVMRRDVVIEERVEVNDGIQ